MSAIKIDLFLLGEKAWNVLKKIPVGYHSHINRVIVGRDRGITIDYASEIIQFCADHNIFCREKSSGIDELSPATRYAIAIGWKWIVNIDSRKLIVIHDSILPKYRGFNPLVSALIAGDRLIGATALFGAKHYDTGEIISQKQVEISYPITISAATDIMSDVYINLIIDLLPRLIEANSIYSRPQNTSGVTYSLWRNESDYFIDWGNSSHEIERFVDAVGPPYAGAKSLLNGENVIVEKVVAVKDVCISNRRSAIGKVIFIQDGSPVIVCQKGLVKILSLRRSDGSPLLPLEKFRSRFS